MQIIIKHKKIIAITCIVLLGLILLTVTIINISIRPKKPETQDPTLNPVIQNESEDLLSILDKIVVLPQNEIPTIATISDSNKIKNQSFFQRAEDGDKVIVYSQSKKAILFRPSLNKVVELSSISLGPTATPTATSSSTIPGRVLISE